MFVRVASYYSYYEQQQYKCDILNADQKSPNHLDLEFEISFKNVYLEFTFSEKATIIDKIFAGNLTVCGNCQFDGEDFVNFCDHLTKYEL